ncbi:hypothetical protein ACWIUA_12160 [Ursidibacter sp. B-7004-1]
MKSQILVTDTSYRAVDQARALEKLLDQLEDVERAELLSLIEKMIDWKNKSG